MSVLPDFFPPSTAGLGRRKKLFPYCFPKTTVRNTLVFELSDVTRELPMSYTEGNYEVSSTDGLVGKQKSQGRSEGAGCADY